MDGYKFYAVMPDARKSKSASKLYPMQPWTRATLRQYAEQGKYVECLAIYGDSFIGANGVLKYGCVGALAEGNAHAVCGSSTTTGYLRERCTRISEDLARKLHPALVTRLEQAND